MLAWQTKVMSSIPGVYIYISEPGIVVPTCKCFGKLRQEDLKFKTNLGNLETLKNYRQKSSAVLYGSRSYI